MSFSSFMYGLKQAVPAKTSWTTADIPDLTGKVACVTGGNTGIGWETCKALLEHNATVYCCARNSEKSLPAIEKLKEVTGNQKIYFLKLDLGDLPTCAAAAKEFATKESKLDLLFLNAGVMTPPLDAKTKQGYELQWGTNVVGHFVFVKLLLPSLLAAAKSETPYSVRVVWTSSSGHMMAPKDIIHFEDINLTKEGTWVRYGQSKAGNILLATYLAHHYANDGILAFSLNPGAINSELQRNRGGFERLMSRWMSFPPAMGAVTQLHAATNPKFNKADSGKYFIPWAKEAVPRKGTQDIELANKLWEFLDKDTAGKY